MPCLPHKKTLPPVPAARHRVCPEHAGSRHTEVSAEAVAVCNSDHFCRICGADTAGSRVPGIDGVADHPALYWHRFGRVSDYSEKERKEPRSEGPGRARGASLTKKVTKHTAKKVVRFALEKKGFAVDLMDLRKITTVTDFFIDSGIIS